MNKADLEEKQERRMRYGFLALLLLVLGGIHFMDPAFYPTVYQLSKSGDLGGLQQCTPCSRVRHDTLRRYAPAPRPCESPAPV